MESNKSPIEIKTSDKVSQDDINLALISHIGTMFGGFFVPLIIWIIKKDESEFVAKHARNALNFQLSMLLYVVVSIILFFIFIGVLLLLAIAVFATIVVILATVAASRGEHYDYPLTINFIK